LSHLVKQVYTVERIKELLKLARRRFHALRLHNIHTRYADGYLGWPTQAPFDGIIVTAASQVIPEELIGQLRIGGKLVMPLERDGQQRLLSIERTEEGFEETDLGAVVFVPMLSGLA
jgi:protein-L-isoaspartate(D-aspartate) O-methyltransferase